MKNQNSLKWIIKNSKGEIPKIVILSISNILLALVATVLALVSKLAIDSAQRAATASSNAEFLHYRNLIIFNCYINSCSYYFKIAFKSFYTKSYN